jgi:hypothetical protein
MRHHPFRILPLIIACAFFLAGASLLAQTAGGNRGTPGRPPTGGPEVGLPGSKQPTTKPGSHESSTKDERDRVAGKFPQPKEKNGSDEARRIAGTAYVDVVALEGQRQALTLTRDDFRVTIDGAPRRVVAVHYVFRGPQASGAARAIAVGKGVVAHADEARTIVIAVDESSFPAGDEQSVKADLERLLQLVGPVDRVAFLTLPRPGPLRFAGTTSDLLAGIAGVVGRPAAGGTSTASQDALTRVLADLLKIQGPKSVILFSAAPTHTLRLVSGTGEAHAAAVSAILDAAAASRAVLHLAVPSGAGLTTAELAAVARSTGGTATRLTGDPNDLAPLAAALLGAYVLDVESPAGDRNGAPHALTITTAVKGVRLLVPSRWMPRFDPMPASVAVVTP